MLRYSLKAIALILMMTIFAADLFAAGPGGIISNPNQSAEWIRTLNRYASTDVDAVFFNPAGTVKLADGTHIGFSNQFPYTELRYKDDSSFLPRDEYSSYIFSPLFPNLHIVNKKENISYMFGIDIMTGGGAGSHDDGLPFSDYTGVMLGAILPALEQGIQIESASARSEFSGYFVGAGFSLGAAYAVSDMFSIAGQLRYIYTTGGNTANITPFLNGVEQPTEELDMTLSGDSFGFILGANIEPMEDFNIGIRYSYYTKMELEQEINDGKDLYGTMAALNGEKKDYTIPQDFAVGASYQIAPRWRVETGFIFYYNEGVDWVEEREGNSGASIENGWEVGVGIEYALLPDKLLTSIGYLYTKSGLPDELQSDLSNKIDAYTIGVGFTYYFKPTFDVTLSYLYSWDDNVVNNQSQIGSTQEIGSTVHTFAVGFNISI